MPLNIAYTQPMLIGYMAKTRHYRGITISLELITQTLVKITNNLLKGNNMKKRIYVKIPFNGNMVVGYIVRYEDIKPFSPFYIVDIGNYRSEKVEATKVVFI